MIQPNELRIGNKVKSPFNDGEIATVNGVAPTYKWIMLDGTITSENLIPIPLTDEILNQLGFTGINRNWSFNDSGFDPNVLFAIIDGKDEFAQPIYRHRFLLGKFNDGFYYQANERRSKGRKIDSLHQLQNLYFAVTDQELEVRTATITPH